jgi:hypothetical protein
MHFFFWLSVFSCSPRRSLPGESHPFLPGLEMGVLKQTFLVMTSLVQPKVPAIGPAKTWCRLESHQGGQARPSD